MQSLQPTAPEHTNNTYIETDLITSHRFSDFQHITPDEIIKITQKYPPRSHELDQLPSTLIMQHAETVAPTICHIVKISPSQGDFIENIKQALVRPLLKKLGLDLELKNYRPVSNLSYLSKIVERAIRTQLMQLAEATGNVEPYQLAYRRGHSTETALLKVKTNLLEAMDNKKGTCMVLLDLSMAFDMVSHDLLLNWLKYRFGFTDTILKWIHNYLTCREQHVVIGSSKDAAMSKPTTLTKGVPQGSILGPALFTLYTSLLGDLRQNMTYSSMGMQTTNKIILLSPLTPQVIRTDV